MAVVCVAIPLLVLLPVLVMLPFAGVVVDMFEVVARTDILVVAVVVEMMVTPLAWR